VAKPLIVVLITDKWLPAVIMLQILAISGATYPLSMVMVKAIAAKGRADLFFQLDLVKTILYFGGILLGSRWGILGVVISITTVNFISLALNALVFSRISSIKISKQVIMILAPLVTSLLMLILLILANRILVLNDLPRLVILIGLGGTLYFLLNYLFNQRMLKEIKQMLALVKTLNQ
jgi:O-antigen/teichoic acid export membrane protein